MSENGQKFFPLLAVVPPPRLATDAELVACSSYKLACKRHLADSRKEPKQIAADMDYSDASMVSRIFSGCRLPHPKRLRGFIESTGSLFLIQWLLWDCGYRVTRREMTVEEKAALWDAQQEQMRAAG